MVPATGYSAENDWGASPGLAYALAAITRHACVSVLSAGTATTDSEGFNTIVAGLKHP